MDYIRPFNDLKVNFLLDVTYFFVGPIGVSCSFCI